MAVKEIIEMEARLVNHISKETNKISKDLNQMDKDGSKAFGNLNKGSKTFGDTMKGFVTGQAIIGAVSKAWRTLNQVASESIDAHKEQVDAETKLAAALFATGNTVGITKDEMIAYSKEMQRTTTFGDEAVVAAQGLFVTFTKIGAEAFPRALEAAADMSAMFGQDLKQSAIQLGTALNDPIAGVGRLKRIGISFSKDQKESIKNFMDQNDVMGAQSVILDELANEFGGVAKALAETDIGKIDQLNNEISDLKEEIGEGLLPIYRQWLKLQKSVLQLFTDTTFKEQQDDINDSLEKNLVIRAELKNNINEIAQLETLTQTEIKGNSQANERLRATQLSDMKRLADLKLRQIDLEKQLAIAQNKGGTPEQLDKREQLGSKKEEKSFDDLIKAENKANAESAKNAQKMAALRLKINRQVEDELDANAIQRGADRNQEAINAQIKALEDEISAIEVVEEAKKILNEASLNAMEDGLDKQLAIIEERYRRELELAQGNKEATDAIKAAIVIEEDAAREVQRQKDDEDRKIRQENIASDVEFAIGLANQLSSAIIAASRQERQQTLETEKIRIDAMEISSKAKTKLLERAEKQNKKAAQKEKKLAIGMAIVNTALAITSAIATAKTNVGRVIAAGLTAAVGAVQIATIAGQSLAGGGVVQGNSFNGDKVPANLNSGEMVFNQPQQAELFRIAKGQGTVNNNNQSSLAVNLVIPENATISDAGADRIAESVLTIGDVLVQADRGGGLDDFKQQLALSFQAG